MPRARVFVVQLHRHRDGADNMVEKYDISDAAKWGDVVYLLDGAQRLDDIPAVVESLYSDLSDMQPGDRLLLIGNPVLIGMAMAVAADVCDGHVGLLYWERRDHSYHPIDIDYGYGER